MKTLWDSFVLSIVSSGSGIGPVGEKSPTETKPLQSERLLGSIMVRMRIGVPSATSGTWGTRMEDNVKRSSWSMLQ